MVVWKNQLEAFDLLSKELIAKKELEQGKLRFNRSSIIASDVAGQRALDIIEVLQ